jgi:hypothetical protein
MFASQAITRAPHPAFWYFWAKSKSTNCALHKSLPSFNGSSIQKSTKVNKKKRLI